MYKDVLGTEGKENESKENGKEFNNEVADELLALVVKQKWLAKVATEKKRQLFRNRMQLFVNIDKDDKKVSVNLIRSLKNTMLSLYYQDQLSVKFSSRNIFDREQADNLNKVAEYDYDEMDMDMRDYDNQGNRIEFGVWIRVMTGRDKDNNKPKFKVFDPMAMFPDPKWYLHINNFDFIWFECDVNVDEMRNWDFYNMDKYDQYMASISPTEQQNNTARMQWREIDNQDSTNASTDVSRTTLYYHYCMYKGKPTQVVTSCNETVIHSAKVVEPLVYKEGNKHKKIKFPVALNYFEPRKGDPRGICLYDIAEDKQKFMTLFYNLMAIKAQREALGGKFFIDSNIYKANKTQLLKPTVGPQYIPVDSNGAAISNLVYWVPQDPISPDVYNFPNIMKQQTTEDVGINDLTRGIGWQQGETATEIQIQQINQNVNLMLGNKINGFGEKTFRKLRYIYYYFYFSDKDKKYIQINRWVESMGDEVTRKDIISPAEPNIAIINKSDAVAQDMKEKADFMALFPMLMQDPMIPQVGKRFMSRKSLKLTGISRQEVETYIPLMPDEMQAKQDVQFLNRNLPVDIMNMDEDHYTFLVIYQSALDTPAKRAAITARQQAYIMSWQQQQQSLMWQQTQWWSQQMGANMLMSNSISQWQNPQAAMQQKPV